jgi:predicted HAD superfamily Cof-like phosphohydrolase
MSIDKDGVGASRSYPLQEQVIEFHRVFDHPIAESPTVPPDERVRLRARLILEECLETIEALFDANSRFVTVSMVEVDAASYLRGAREALNVLINQATVHVRLESFADGLADVDYVVEGSRIEFGLEGGGIAREVHRSNMAKKGGGTRADGKSEKPPGWTPPDIAGVIRKQKDEPLEYGLAGILADLQDGGVE